MKIRMMVPNLSEWPVKLSQLLNESTATAYDAGNADSANNANARDADSVNSADDANDA